MSNEVDNANVDTLCVVSGESNTDVKQKSVTFVTPPITIRSTIDETAAFAAELGLNTFLQMIQESNVEGQFKFASKDHPYYDYFFDKVKQYKSNNVNDIEIPIPKEIVELRSLQSEKKQMLKGREKSQWSKRDYEQLNTDCAPIKNPSKLVKLNNLKNYKISSTKSSVIDEAALFSALAGHNFLDAALKLSNLNESLSFLNPDDRLHSLFLSRVNFNKSILASCPKLLDWLSCYSDEQSFDQLVLSIKKQQEDEDAEEQRQRETRSQIEVFDESNDNRDKYQFIVIYTVSFNSSDENRKLPEFNSEEC